MPRVGRIRWAPAALVACIGTLLVGCVPAVAAQAHPPRARAAASTPDTRCLLELGQRPHLSTTGRRRGKSEAVWKVTVKCQYGKIVAGKFVSSGVPAVMPFLHVRLALYRNSKQVGSKVVDKPGVSRLTVPVAGPCTAGAIYQGWGKSFAALPPGTRDYYTGAQFSVVQGWGNLRRIRRC